MLSRGNREMCAARRTGYDLAAASEAALRRLADEYRNRAARRIIHALQRSPATGVYGYDYRHRSLWDELCHKTQSGPYWDDDLWDSVLDPLLEREVGRLTPAEIEIVWLSTLPDVDDLQTAARDPEVVSEALRSGLMEAAGNRNMERFEVW